MSLDPSNPEHCKSILWTLVKAFHSPPSEMTSIRASFLIRELFQMQHCFQKLSKVRDSYETTIGKERVQMINNFETVVDDLTEDKCTQALFHHRTWTRDMLVGQLDMGTWVYYHTIFKAERHVATLTRRIVN